MLKRKREKERERERNGETESEKHYYGEACATVLKLQYILVSFLSLHYFLHGGKEWRDWNP
jgi:hypothetical protein